MKPKTKPYSETELRAMRIWPAGDYVFKITAVDDHDKSGHLLMGGKNSAFPKSQLTIRIWDEKEKSKLQFDDLIDDEQFSWKMRHVFHAVGLGDIYDRGEHDTNMLLEKTGWLTLAIKPASDKYDEKNVIRDYIVPDTSITESKKDDDFNDDIPNF